jgi:hypothetical protein
MRVKVIQYTVCRTGRKGSHGKTETFLRSALVRAEEKIENKTRE